MGAVEDRAALTRARNALNDAYNQLQQHDQQAAMATLDTAYRLAFDALAASDDPVPPLSEREPKRRTLFCPHCGTRHIDEGEWATRLHHVHQCQDCGHEWDEGELAFGIAPDAPPLAPGDRVLIEAMFSGGDPNGQVKVLINNGMERPMPVWLPAARVHRQREEPRC